MGTGYATAMARCAGGCGFFGSISAEGQVGLFCSQCAPKAAEAGVSEQVAADVTRVKSVEELLTEDLERVASKKEEEAKAEAVKPKPRRKKEKQSYKDMMAALR